MRNAGWVHCFFPDMLMSDKENYQRYLRAILSNEASIHESWWCEDPHVKQRRTNLRAANDKGWILQHGRLLTESQQASIERILATAVFEQCSWSVELLRAIEAKLMEAYNYLYLVDNHGGYMTDSGAQQPPGLPMVCAILHWIVLRRDSMQGIVHVALGRLPIAMESVPWRPATGMASVRMAPWHMILRARP